MKTTTHGTLHRVPTKSEEEIKPRRDSDEVEATVWVMIAIFAALVVVFGYLFWNKF